MSYDVHPSLQINPSVLSLWVLSFCFLVVLLSSISL